MQKKKTEPRLIAMNINELADLKLIALERVALLYDLAIDIIDEITEFREVLYYSKNHNTLEKMSNVQPPLRSEEREKATKEKNVSMLEMQEMFIPVYRLKQKADKKKPKA